MSSTNKTTYYELPQYEDNDIFNPLVDDNDAYSKIDTALHNIAGAEADDASEIVGIKSRLDSAEGDIDALEAQNGNTVLTTEAQTLSGAVNELDADVSSLDGRLDIVEDDINNVSTGLKVKVSALEQHDSKEGFVTPEMFGAVGDGVTDDADAIQLAFDSGKNVVGVGKYYCGKNITSNCNKKITGLVVELHPDYYMIIEGDDTMLVNCEFTHGDDFLTATGRGKFLVAVWADNCVIDGCYFHDTVSAVFNGAEKDNFVVCNCTFKNCKQIPNALTQGVNGYGIVMDSVKKANIHDNIFIDVTRHAIYISSSSGEVAPSDIVIIANNTFKLTDRGSDKHITNFETQIMCRECVKVEVTGNVFDNVYGGCFTYGGDYDFSKSLLIFENNIVNDFWTVSPYEYFGIVNITTSTVVTRDIVVKSNTITNCGGTVVNGDHDFNTCEISDNSIDTSNFVADLSRSNPASSNFNKLTLKNNIINTSYAVIRLNNNIDDIEIRDNAILDSDNNSHYLLSTSNGTYHPTNFICDGNIFGEINPDFTNFVNVILTNNVAKSLLTVTHGSITTSFMMYNNVNMTRYGSAKDEVPQSIKVETTDGTIDGMLKTVMKSVFDNIREQDKAISIAIDGHSMGQWIGVVKKRPTSVFYEITSNGTGYVGFYNNSDDTVSNAPLVTSANYDSTVSRIRQIPTTQGTEYNIEFPDTDTQILLFCEGNASVSYIYFNGVNAYAVALTGVAHTVTVVDAKNIKVEAQYSSRAMIACAKHVTITAVT